MNTSTSYTELQQTELFNRYGVFFAFSNEQLKEGLDKLKQDGILLEGEKLTRLPYGMFAPSKHAETILKELEQIHKDGLANDLKENGKEGVIIRELYNHECFYTGDYSQAYENALQSYGITLDEVRQAYYKELPNSDL